MKRMGEDEGVAYRKTSGEMKKMKEVGGSAKYDRRWKRKDERKEHRRMKCK